MVYNLIKLYGENTLQSSYADTVGITTFDSTNQNGFLSYLPDAISPVVTEEINGQFDLEMQYPVTGEGYEYLQVKRIVACKPNPHDSIQGFRIYKISKPINGIVDVSAYHISYDLNGYVLNPFTVTNKTPDQVIKAFKTNSSTTCPFTFSSDINKTVSKFAVSKPITIREMLGGELSNELSLVQTTGGEFVFDNLSVALKSARGSDNGVVISYGKNLTDFTYDEDTSGFYSGVYPFWVTTEKSDEDSSVTPVTPSVSNSQSFEATAQYGNMNLVLTVSKGSTSGSNTTLNWALSFRIVVAGGYNFNYQNSCSVSINGTQVFSSGNVKAININGMSAGQTVSLASGTTTVPSSKETVGVSAQFIQRQDLRGTWKISGTYAMSGGTEVVTNVTSNDVYHLVTLSGTKTMDYDGDFKYQRYYPLDLSKEIEAGKDANNKPVYPTPAQLKTAAEKYIAENDLTISNESLEVSFVDLDQSSDYANYKGLETVSLGDLVTVQYSLYGISKTKECVKTEYDVMSGQYTSITLGELTETLASTIQNGNSTATRLTMDSRILANSVNANFNNIQALNASFDTVTAEVVNVTGRLTAAEANIGTLSADYGEFKSLTTSNFTAVNASITNLSTVYATISALSATNASITNLSTVYATISALSATNASITNLSTVYATISALSATNASITNLSTVYATISALSATNASITNLSTVYATISALSATNASIATLSAGKADIDFANVTWADIDGAFIDSLDANYANIDFANVGVANVAELFATSGIIDNLVVQDGHLTGELQFVTLNGDLIEVGTLVADKIVFLGEDGLYYQLNTNGETVGASQTVYNSLNGSVITAQSVTADKIYVSDLYAFNATIAGLELEQGSIHTVNKDSVLNTTTGVYIGPTSMAIGDASNFLIYNNGQLSISGAVTATSLTLGSGVTLAASNITGLSTVATSGDFDDLTNKPMIPSLTGYIYVDGTIGTTPAEGATGFVVDKDGSLQASNALIYGTIYASAGKIAGWNIGSNNIQKLTSNWSTVTGSDKAYRVDLFAPDTPDPANNRAFSVTERTYNSSTSTRVNEYPFAVYYDGSLVATKATINGTITADDGKIGNWTITATQLYNNTADVDTTDAIQRGALINAPLAPTDTNSAFAVRYRTWTGSAYSSWTYPFIVRYNGNVEASYIIAKGGYIGGTTGWVITTGKIYKGTAGAASGIVLDATAGTTATVAGASHANLMITAGTNFGVDKNGNLYATNVSISGVITATGGTFGASNGARLQISGTNINILDTSGTARGYISAGTGYIVIHGTSGVQLDGVLVNENTYSQSASGGRSVLVTSGGTFGTSASSKRYKKDIVPTGDKYFDCLLSIEPVTFKYTNVKPGEEWYNEDIPGFIAEDVADKYPIGVFYNESGLVEDWNDRLILVGTLALLQKLYKRVDELERKIAAYD